MRMAGNALAGLFSGANTLDFGMGAEANMNGRANERVTGHQSEAKVAGYGMRAVADLKAQEALAEATIAQGQAAGQAAMVSGIADGISGIASGLGQKSLANQKYGQNLKTSDIDYSGAWSGGHGISTGTTAGSWKAPGGATPQFNTGVAWDW